MPETRDEAGPSDRVVDARALRRQRRRVVMVMVAALVVLILAVAVVVDQTWLAQPDLAVGSRHQATVQVEHPCGPNSVVLRLVRYGGYVWWVDGAPAAPLPAEVRGTLVITHPVTNGTGPTSTRDTADFEYGGHVFPLEGGNQSGPWFSCPVP